MHVAIRSLLLPGLFSLGLATADAVMPLDPGGSTNHPAAKVERDEPNPID